MYIAGAVIAALFGLLVWWHIKLAAAQVQASHWEAEAVKSATLAANREMQISALEQSIQASNERIAHWEAEARAAQAVSLELLAEVEVSRKASQGRITAILRSGADSCESVMPKVREVLGL